MTAVSFSPDGRLVAGAWGPSCLTVWDVSSGVARYSIRAGVGSAINCLRFTPAGDHIVLGDTHGEVIALRVSDRVLVGRWEIPAENPETPQIGAADTIRSTTITSLDIASDGKRIVVSRWKAKSTEAIVWTFGSPDPVLRIDQPNEVAARNRRVFHAVRFSPDASQLISAGAPFHFPDVAQSGRRAMEVQVREIRHWDATTGKLLAERTYNGGLRDDEFEIVLPAAMGNSLNDVAPIYNSGDLDVAADGAVATFADGIQLWRSGAKAPFRRIPDVGRVFKLTPDGRRVAVSVGNSVKIVDVPAGGQIEK
jgi:WD40 repeat protein